MWFKRKQKSIRRKLETLIIITTRNMAYNKDKVRPSKYRNSSIYNYIYKDNGPWSRGLWRIPGG